eukprot:767218-Hanusia_phi.AAC.5
MGGGTHDGFVRRNDLREHRQTWRMRGREGEERRGEERKGEEGRGEERDVLDERGERRTGAEKTGQHRKGQERTGKESDIERKRVDEVRCNVMGTSHRSKLCCADLVQQGHHHYFPEHRFKLFASQSCQTRWRSLSLLQ